MQLSKAMPKQYSQMLQHGTFQSKSYAAGRRPFKIDSNSYCSSDLGLFHSKWQPQDFLLGEHEAFYEATFGTSPSSGFCLHFAHNAGNVNFATVFSSFLPLHFQCIYAD